MYLVSSSSRLPLVFLSSSALGLALVLLLSCSSFAETDPTADASVNIGQIQNAGSLSITSYVQYSYKGSDGNYHLSVPMPSSEIYSYPKGSMTRTGTAYAQIQNETNGTITLGTNATVQLSVFGYTDFNAATASANISLGSGSGSATASGSCMGLNGVINSGNTATYSFSQTVWHQGDSFTQSGPFNLSTYGGK